MALPFLCRLLWKLQLPSHEKSQDPLQPSSIQAVWPFTNYNTSLIFPKYVYQKYSHPFTWITSYFFDVEQEWMDSLWFSKNKTFPKAPKKKSRERTGLQPTCMLEVKKDMELNNPLIQMDFNNFLWGKGVRQIKELESLKTNVTLYHVKITWESLFVDLFLWWKTEAMYESQGRWRELSF